MNIERLVTMANEIAAFFASEKDKEQAAELMATHLRRYWEPRMRKAIIAHEHAGGSGLTALARRAVAKLA